jgi:NAD(P)H-dependent FMN reductase
MTSLSIVCGTSRPNALSPNLARQYQRLVAQRYEHWELHTLDLARLPANYLIDAYRDGSTEPSPARFFQEAIDRSQAVVFLFPEYNGSFPGALKVFLDGLRYPGTMEGKRCSLVCLGAGAQGGSLAMSHLADILSYMGAFLVPLRVRIPHVYEKLNGNYELADTDTIELIRTQIDQLAWLLAEAEERPQTQ